VNLPGTRGGCRDGLAVLEPVLGHAIDQVAGVDHTASGTDQVDSGAHLHHAHHGHHSHHGHPDSLQVDTD
jgi:hypothetical protein